MGLDEMMGGKHINGKTVLSFDTTTDCPQRRAGKACAYCYVEASRKEGFRAKSVIEHAEYDRFALRLRDDKVKELNKIGGMRMFSFGDYLRLHEEDVAKFLDDCQVKNLWAKAITKQPSFIYDFHDHPALHVVHISIDSLKGDVGRSPVTWRMARKLREDYDKVRVRAVCLSMRDVETFGALEWVDILTLNHGRNQFHHFSKMEMEKVNKKFPNRTCCTTGTCTSCKLKCAVN